MTSHMTAQIIDGKKIATEIKNEIALTIKNRLNNNQRAPGLAVILVGADPASQIYVNNKRQACEKTGIKSFSYDLPTSTTQEELLFLIADLNRNPEVDGILVQLPLPNHIDQNIIVEAISIHKDVDGFHPYSLGRLVQRRPLLRPCTPFGVITLLNRYNIPLESRNAVVIGASNNVGRPMALELLLAAATVTTCHRFTIDLENHVKRADILVVATGKRDVVKSEWIKPGSVVVDIGIHRLEDGSICGDMDFETAKERAAWITPVPGGVGQMTVVTLLQNTLFAAENFDSTQYIRQLK